MYLILEALMLVSLGGLIAVFQNDLLGWTALLKSITSLLFVFAGICGYRERKQNKKISRTMMIALLCSLAGDVFLALDKEEGILFILGVASFALAHVMFSVSFCRMSAVKKMDFAGMFLIFGAEMLILRLGEFDFQGLFPVLVIYAGIISFMVVKALSLFRCRQGRARATYLIMAGGVLFLLSDILLLFWLFGIGMPKEIQSVNWILYYLAQGCLSASLSEKICGPFTKSENHAVRLTD